MSEKAQAAREYLIERIGADLEASIAVLGYPVGMGVAPNTETCRKAAATILDRIGDQALALLAERKP